MIFLCLKENICCDPSLEPSRRDVLMMGHKYVFLRKNMDKYPEIIPITYSYLEDCCLFIKGNTPSHTGNYIAGS